MVDSKRTDRVGDQIRMEIADILMRQVRDPRIGFVTVTRVTLTPDLRQAWIYLTVLQPDASDADAQEAETMAALSRARGFIRGELGRRLKLRYVPELTFVKDESVGRVERVLKLLDELHSEPKEGSRDTEAPERHGV